jgi:hypothetical protein
MIISTRGILRVTAAIAMVAAPLPAVAQQYENPPSFNVAKIPGIRAAGDNYAIVNPARSDGLLRLYRVTTAPGEITVHGDEMLRMRLHELDALNQLDKINNSEAFGKALAEAGLSPLKYTGRFIANPAKTDSETFTGIGNMFGRIASGMANAGRAPGNPIAGLLGVTEQRRKLAAEFGVDPYPDYEPLDFRLSRLSEAAAAGGLTVSGALIAVPGAAGIVVSNLHTASSLQGIQIETLARDYTAAQILDLNRGRMNAMGADPTLIESLLGNRNYTPIDLAAMVAALDGMSGVEDRTLFLERAAAIDNRAIAYFMRRHAELLAAHHARAAKFSRFVSLGGYPFAVTRHGRIVSVMPIDALAWTQSTGGALRDSAADARRLVASGQVELRITGSATALAKRQLQGLGWKLVERAKF